MCSSFERILEKEKAEGRAEEKANSILELLEDLGELPEALRNYILKEKDLEVLRKWHKAAGSPMILITAPTNIAPIA